ncbi:MAG: hypothetical protein MZW92_02490 [Comamonadaceae bacterium]|nr:hypothetical protein [Comamonadaceae bacterium]
MIILNAVFKLTKKGKGGLFAGIVLDPFLPRRDVHRSQRDPDHPACGPGGIAYGILVTQRDAKGGEPHA